MAVDPGPVNEACLGLWGEEITHAPTNGPAYTLTGILEDPWMLEGDSPESYVVVFAQDSDFTTTPAKGDMVTVQGTTYNVIDKLPAVAGGIRLRLHKA